MEFLVGVLTGTHSLDGLIRWGGYVLLAVIVFTETGLLVGFFLPGDSLLITAGLVAAAGVLNIWWINVILIVAAVVGDSVGYAIGARLGPALFTREKSLLFNPRHVERTREFYARHGARTIVIARFVPIIRTFAPVVAGVGRMEYRKFLTYNVAGGVGWVVSMTWAGYLLGSVIPNIDQYIHVVVLSSSCCRVCRFCSRSSARVVVRRRRGQDVIRRRLLLGVIMTGACLIRVGPVNGQEAVSARVGTVTGTALASGPRPASPPVPLTALEVLLLPRSDAVLASLERIKRQSRDSMSGYRTAIP